MLVNVVQYLCFCFNFELLQFITDVKFSLLYTFIHQGCINLIKSDSKDFYIAV